MRNPRVLPLPVLAAAKTSRPRKRKENVSQHDKATSHNYRSRIYRRLELVCFVLFHQQQFFVYTKNNATTINKAHFAHSKIAILNLVQAPGKNC